MDRTDVVELHFITHCENLPSIIEHGILCHKSMTKISHRSIANVEVQDLRAGIVVPGGRELHDYANLYFDARNPMMFVVRKVRKIREIVVVRVSHEVLDLPGTVVADGNAASSTTEFHDPASELHLLDKEHVYAVSWNKLDPFEKTERKRQRCAEVLVLVSVAPSMLRGFYAETAAQAEACRSLAPSLPVEVKPNVFFS